jgi:hypothetical protein
MTHAPHPRRRASCGSLLLVAARTAPDWGAVYLADPAIRLPLVERLRLRWPLDGHTPTVTAATPAQLTWMLWAIAMRMGLRYLAALLAAATVALTRRLLPRLARWAAAVSSRPTRLVVVSKQLLPTTTTPQPQAALLRGPLAALACHGRLVGIHVWLDVTDGPGDPVDLGRAGRNLEEVSLRWPDTDQAAAGHPLAGAGRRHTRNR